MNNSGLVIKLRKNCKVDYVVCFEEFCANSKSLKYVHKETIEKCPYLQPLLENFIKYLKQENIYKEFNTQITHNAKITHMEENGFMIWFEYITNNISNEITYYFMIYMQNYLNIYQCQYQFEHWAINSSKITEDAQIRLEDIMRSNRKRELIKIARNYHSENLGNNTCICKDLDYYDSDFIKFLDNKVLRIGESISGHRLDEVIDEYHSQNPEVDKNKLKKFVKQLNNKRFLVTMIEKVIKNKMNNFDIDRYYKCENHGILLFREADRYSEFLHRYISDLDKLTANTLDIYYAKEDLNSNISAYDRINRLCYLGVKKHEIPCFLIWNRRNEEVDSVSLEDLTHTEVFKVIKELVLSLEDTGDFRQSILKTKVKSEEIKRKTRVSINISNSNIGAVGYQAMVYNPIFKKNNEGD